MTPAERREWAEEHAANLLATLPGCVCVRAWEGAGGYVDGPADRWAGLLLAFEMSGDDATRREMEDAERFLRAAWREAAEAWELVDGSHGDAMGWAR